MNWLWQIFDPDTIGAFFTQFRNEMADPTFWIAVGKIIWINILLSGDNALVIALACRGLKPRHQLWGMVFGAGAAVLLRIIFTGIVVALMGLPCLKLVGGLALLVIAAKLLVPEHEDEGNVDAAAHLWAAVQIVAIADIVMSLDNVIAIAAAAELAAAQVDAAHAAAIKATLIIFGLATSVPLIIAGSAILMALLHRFRVLVWGGGALLGWVAGDIMSGDPVIVKWFGEGVAAGLHGWGGRFGALIVVGVGLWIVRVRRTWTSEEIWTLFALLVWIAADMLIGQSFAPAESGKIWTARLVV